MSAQQKMALSKGQTWHPIALLVVAPTSALLGFIAVVSLSGQHRISAPTLTERGDGGADAARTAFDGAEDAPGETKSGAELLSAINYVPAPRVKMADPYYWRCWDAGSDKALHNEACDRMRRLERVVASRLGDLVKCYQTLDRPGATGVLSLAVDLDFSQEEENTDELVVKFWNGRSTTIDGADELVNCFRQKIEKLPLKRVRHNRERYTIFFPIEFEAEGEGTSVELVLDRVRLRAEPVKGSIIARLRQGEPIRVLEVLEGWARIKTADNQEGWVFMDAITLSDP